LRQLELGTSFTALGDGVRRGGRTAVFLNATVNEKGSSKLSASGLE
jgi:hypothetical protein